MSNDQLSNSEGNIAFQAPLHPGNASFEDEALPLSPSTSFATTIPSYIWVGVEENGRLYPALGTHEYGLPMDEEEQRRLAWQHKIYLALFRGRLFLSPIGSSPQQILDLATGTGEWAIAVADKFPSAEVIGVDIAPIQPSWVPPNCSFEVDDIESPWLYKKNNFDFIHLRDPILVVRDWSRLISQCYEHLREGGWCELSGLCFVPLCDDDSMPTDSAFKVVSTQLLIASERWGTPVDYSLHFAERLRAAQFVNVTTCVQKIPVSPWSSTTSDQLLGLLEMESLARCVPALGLRVFSRGFGWSVQQIEEKMDVYLRDLQETSYHQYYEYITVYGQKPTTL